MRFSLTIDCDNAAFAPYSEDADEAERYDSAACEVARIIGRTAGHLQDVVSGNVRTGALHDLNGNRCGQWSLSDMDDAPGEEIKAEPVPGQANHFRLNEAGRAAIAAARAAAAPSWRVAFNTGRGGWRLLDERYASEAEAETAAKEKRAILDHVTQVVRED